MSKETVDPGSIGIRELGEKFQAIIESFQNGDFEKINCPTPSNNKGHEEMIFFTFIKPNEFFYINNLTGSITAHNWVLDEIAALLENKKQKAN